MIWTMLLNEVLLQWYGQLMVTSAINVVQSVHQLVKCIVHGMINCSITVASSTNLIFFSTVHTFSQYLVRHIIAISTQDMLPSI